MSYILEKLHIWGYQWSVWYTDENVQLKGLWFDLMILYLYDNLVLKEEQSDMNQNTGWSLGF